MAAAAAINVRGHTTNIRPGPYPTVAPPVLALMTLMILLPASVGATVALKLPLPRMVQVAELVIEGTVSNFDLRRGTTEQGTMCPRLQLPYTDITVDVDTVYKGRISTPRVIVRVFGGRLECNRILQDTFLRFRRGERVLLFLEMNGRDDFPFPGFHQGIVEFDHPGDQCHFVGAFIDSTGQIAESNETNNKVISKWKLCP